MKIHKRFGEKSKLAAKIEIGDVIPYASSVSGSDLKKMLRERGYESKYDVVSAHKVKAFGCVVITSAI